MRTAATSGPSQKCEPTNPAPPAARSLPSASRRSGAGGNPCLKSFWRTARSRPALLLVEPAVSCRIISRSATRCLCVRQVAISQAAHEVDHPETGGHRGWRGKLDPHQPRIAPIYPLHRGDCRSAGCVRPLVWRTLAQFEADLDEPIPAIVPPDFPRIAPAQSGCSIFPRRRRTLRKARRRLALDEFISLQSAKSRHGAEVRFEACARSACRAPATTGSSNRSSHGSVFSADERADTCVLREIRHDMGAGVSHAGACSRATSVPARRWWRHTTALMALESTYHVALMVR